jgi:hypothetical protein
MRFRPRFTIRDLLWLTLLVAMAIGWWLDHRELAPLASRTEQIIKIAQQQQHTISDIIGSNHNLDIWDRRMEEALRRLRQFDPKLVEAAIPGYDRNSFPPLPDPKNYPLAPGNAPPANGL